MFKPLEDTVALLTRFGDAPDAELLRQLEDGPRQWRLLCKKMFRRAGAGTLCCWPCGRLLSRSKRALRCALILLPLSPLSSL